MAEEVIIIGAGVAGLTAAIYTAREGFSPLVLTGNEMGGQLILSSEVENYPGFPDGITGMALMDLMKNQAERFGAKFIYDSILEVNFSQRPYVLKTPSQTLYAKCVIIATGASAKWLNITSERQFIGRGISSCATCDAPFFKEKSVVVVGGGDTAMVDSLFLSKFAKSVLIVHRRNNFRGSKLMQEKVFSNEKIKVLWNTEVTEAMGRTSLERITLRNTNTGKTRVIETDGLFVAIGHDPNSQFLRGQLPLTNDGYVIAQDEVATGIEGVYVAGDIADNKYRQAVTAAGSGCKAALEVRSYLHGLNHAL